MPLPQASRAQLQTFQALGSLLSGQLLSAIAGLLLGKGIALYVPQAEFGVYSLGLATLTLIHAVMISPVLQSLKAEQAELGWARVLPFYGRLLLAIYTFSALFAISWGAITDNLSVSLLIATAFVGQGLYAIGSESINLAGKFRAFSLVQGGYGVINLLLFGAVVVASGNASAKGLWLTLAIVNGLFSLITWAMFWQHRQLSEAAEYPPVVVSLWRSLRQYAAPLVGLGLWSWLINYADRYLINYYLSSADVGVYSVGYGLGSKLLLLLGPFMSHLSSRLYKLRSEGADGHAAWQLQRYYLFSYGALALIACLLFYFTQDWVGQLLLSEAYRGAYAIGPIVAFGYLLLTLINLLEIKWYVFSQTYLVFWHYLAGAVLNIGLNLLLIPRFQLFGAALASLLSYGCQLGMVVWLYQRHLSVNVPNRTQELQR